MKIGILGGAFDPPHNGHIALGRAALRELGLEKVLFIPTRVPPHKSVKSGLSPEMRIYLTLLAVCRIDPSNAGMFAVALRIFTGGSPGLRDFMAQYKLAFLRGADSQFEVSGIEIAREDGKPSYTYDTVVTLLEKHPEWKPTVIIGTDQADTLDTWYRIDELTKIAEFAVAGRAGFDIETIRRKFPYIKPFEFPPTDISSTMVREHIRNKLSINGLVPPQIEPVLLSRALRNKF
ncbi:MAG: hypothetical protein A2Y33_03710 [Spirochaetes bacterium GWF1_51_8]|nr:MAG: hypothetical protein A2Y33_03710 [Spirochaetes bacterium GWF1_51_8]